MTAAFTIKAVIVLIAAIWFASGENDGRGKVQE